MEQALRLVHNEVNNATVQNDQVSIDDNFQSVDNASSILTSSVDISPLLLACFKSNEKDPIQQPVEDWLCSLIGSLNNNIDDTLLSRVHYILQKSIIIIDKLINQQVEEIIHHARFKQLESSWCGLRYLAETEADYDEELTIKLKVLNITWKELSKDFSRAIEFDQSQIFQRIYSDEYDMPGGEPFGVVLGDYKISHKHRPGMLLNDLDIIKEMSQVASAALSPFITGVDSTLFGVDSLRELAYPINLQQVFSQQEYVKWHALRKEESTRYIGLTLPDVLIRKPYQKDGTRFEQHSFQESDCDAESDYLWGNSCYAFGGVLIRAFANTGWFADIRGGVHKFGEGGEIRNLQYAKFSLDSASLATRPAANIQIDDYLEREFSDLGFIPLCSYHSEKSSVFYSNNSLHESQNFTTNIANANARLSAMIQYMMCVSRFAHYIKVIARDKVGSLATTEDCEILFQNWLNEYTTASDSSSAVLKAQYPLAKSNVDIVELPAKPGCYSCVVHLKPHFQLDQLVSSIKLVTELSVGTIGTG